jgi:hypothetical protein
MLTTDKIGDSCDAPDVQDRTEEVEGIADAAARAVLAKINPRLPVVGSRWRHRLDSAVRLEITYYKACLVKYRRVLRDGTYGLETEAGLRRFHATFVPEEDSNG